MWDLESTTEMLRDISAADGPDDLLRMILMHARRHTRLDRAIVLSREDLVSPAFRVVLDVSCDVSQSPLHLSSTGSHRSGGLLADLLYAGEFRSLTDLNGLHDDPCLDLLGSARSLIAFPLFDHREATGMVVMLARGLHACQPAEVFGLSVMGALLQRANRADELARQLDHTCRELDSELAAAASVQRWLLPHPTAQSCGVRTAALYRTARRSGGDYYDSGPLPDGRFGVMIADVSGHGAAATVLMAILRTIVHDEVDLTPVTGPANLLDFADHRLCPLDLGHHGAFITAFSGALDTRTGEFRYACAGHPPPRWISARGGSVRPVDGANSRPLGLADEQVPRTEESLQLSPGDLIVLYSDGITEARSPAGEFFGIDGLDRALSTLTTPLTPDAAVTAIDQALTSFTELELPLDDQTILAVQWVGGPETACGHPHCG
jgi:sigma-B regulation protein RsbU (phosphoserine phosphatase)